MQELEQDGLMLGLFLEGAFTFVESPVRLVTVENAGDSRSGHPYGNWGTDGTFTLA